MVKPNEKKAPHARLAKGFVATFTAVALAAAPVTSALAMQVTRGENANSSAYQADIAGSGIDVNEVVRQAYMQGVAGAADLQTYLNGYPISEEAALGIDAGALYGISGEIAREISDLQASLLAGTYAPSQGEEEYPVVEPDYDVDADESVNTDDGTYIEPEPEPETQTEDETIYETTEEESTAQDDAASSAVNETTPTESTQETVVAEPEVAATEDSKTSVIEVVSEDNPITIEDFEAIVEEEASSPYPEWSYSGDTSFPIRKTNVSLTTEKFIAIIGEQARKICQENDLYASVMIAQAILESGSGSSSLSASYNNLFGIKGRYEGNGVVMRTNEDDGTGTNYSTFSVFRSYPTTYDSLTDYADLLTVSMADYYSPAWKSNAETYVDACDYLQGHYATDTTYSAKLQSLILTYDLTRFDDPLDYEMVDTYEVTLTDETTGEALIDEETGEELTEERDLVDLVVELTSHLGEPYVWGGTTPGSFDCSGLVQYCYNKALGISLPRTTYFQCLEGEDVDFEDLHMGDLLFFVDSNNLASHVAVYLGEGCYIEAPHTGDFVKVTSLEEKTPTFAKRIVETRDVDAEEAATTAAANRTKIAVSSTTTVTVSKEIEEEYTSLKGMVSGVVETIADKVADDLLESISMDLD